MRVFWRKCLLTSLRLQATTIGKPEINKRCLAHRCRIMSRRFQAKVPNLRETPRHWCYDASLSVLLPHSFTRGKPQEDVAPVGPTEGQGISYS